MQAPTTTGATPAVPLTTADIQQMLEENAKMIQAVVENQNLNKMDECLQYSKRLQENLMQLAALADSQAVPASQPPVTQQSQ
ncbi:CPL7 [Auxenochlorella protothecoides x Auxenochlorella symbiontica]